MNASVTARKRLEALKFGLYLAVPIGLYCFVAYMPSGLDYFVNKMQYVVYPPSGPEGIAYKQQQEAEKRAAARSAA